MAAIHRESLKCPTCNHDFKASIYASVNVSLDPSLKEKLLNGEINRVRCPECKKETTIAADLLYHDMDNRLLLQAIWGDEQKWDEEEARFEENLRSYETEYPMLGRTLDPMRKEFTWRLVFGYDQLCEKILIFDAKLDDRIIEFVKFSLLLKPDSFKGLFEKGASLEILFEDAEKTKISFTCTSSRNDPVCFSLDRQTYDDIMNDPDAKEEALQFFKDAFYVNFNRIYTRLLHNNE